MNSYNVKSINYIFYNLQNILRLIMFNQVHDKVTVDQHSADISLNQTKE